MFMIMIIYLYIYIFIRICYIVFPNVTPTVTEVKESVSKATANLYFQHKTTTYKKVSTISYMANIIITYNGPRAGEIMHIIYK